MAVLRVVALVVGAVDAVLVAMEVVTAAARRAASAVAAATVRAAVVVVKVVERLAVR